MVNTDDATTAVGMNLKSNVVSVDSPKTKLNNLSEYFVKDILNILESKDKKGKTKLKEIRSKMYGYLKRF